LEVIYGGLQTSQAENLGDSFFHDYSDGNRKLLDPMTWISNSVVQFPEANDRKHIQQSPSKDVDQVAVEEATRFWRESS
jgi:hypothetical protein